MCSKPQAAPPQSPSLLRRPAEGEAPLCNKIPIFLIHLLFLLRKNWKKDRPHGTSQKPTDTNETSPDSYTWDVLGPSLEGPSAPSNSGAGGRGAWRKQDWLAREVSSSLNRSWAEHPALNFPPKSLRGNKSKHAFFAQHHKVPFVVCSLMFRDERQSRRQFITKLNYH